MHRRVVKKSKVVREGYIKGLQEARRIIESMLGEGSDIDETDIDSDVSYEAVANLRDIQELDRHDNIVDSSDRKADFVIGFRDADELAKLIAKEYGLNVRGELERDGSGEPGQYVFSWYTLDKAGNKPLPEGYDGDASIFRHNVYLTIYKVVRGRVNID